MQIVISIKKVRQLPSSKNSVQRVEFSFLFISIIHLFYLERMALSFMGEESSLFHGKVCEHDLYKERHLPGEHV